MNEIPQENIDYKKLIENLPFAYRHESNGAQIRTETDDFKVYELLSFEPSGEGEHLFLQIEKRDTNTEWVARQLQNTFGLTSKEIGYAGKKDRHSLSTQWFSLHLPGKEVDLTVLSNGAFRVVRSIRHNKKLRLGSVKENQFEIVLKNLSHPINKALVQQVIQHGVPNYFGQQRFGFDCNNLLTADLFLNQKIKIKNRNKKGLIISSSRSLLFNLILAQRIKNKNWNEAITGDCLMLNGSQSYFCLTEAVTPSDQQRLLDGDIHICGLLPGKQFSEALSESKRIEDGILSNYQGWITAYDRLNLNSARRAFRMSVKGLVIEEFESSAKLYFSLSKGCFATSVLRELVDVKDMAVRKKTSDIRDK